MKKWATILLTLLLSLSIHHFIFLGLYRRSSDPKESEPPKEQIAKLRIKETIPDHRKEKGKPRLSKQPVKSRFKLPENVLVSSGMKVLKGDLGSFPALSIHYPSPRRYFAQIYSIGAKTLIFDKTLDKLLGEIDVFSSKITPTELSFKNLSPVKRVVEDGMVDEVKVKIASQNGALPSDYEIWLLIPRDLEAKWLGYQLEIFKLYDVKSHQVAQVDSYFDGKLKIRKIRLKSGRTIIVDLSGGV